MLLVGHDFLILPRTQLRRKLLGTWGALTSRQKLVLGNENKKNPSTCTLLFEHTFGTLSGHWWTLVISFELTKLLHQLQATFARMHLVCCTSHCLHSFEPIEFDCTFIFFVLNKTITLWMCRAGYLEYMLRGRLQLKHVQSALNSPARQKTPASFHWPRNWREHI